jgi:hypothetical protein
MLAEFKNDFRVRQCRILPIAQMWFGETTVVHRWLLRHPRFHLHVTPTYASWLNLVERFFGLLTEKALRRGSHTSVPQLREAILAYVNAHNEKGKLFKWTKTADEILDQMRRFGLRTQQVHGS